MSWNSPTSVSVSLSPVPATCCTITEGSVGSPSRSLATSIHHSSPFFNYSTALRQSWIPFHVFVFWLPLPFLGFDPLMVMTMTLANLFFQSLQHTTFTGLPRWYTYIFNAPEHHRVHHASNPELVDRNFGGIFIVWDRLFGTFARESDAREPIRFGIEPMPSSFNPFWLEIHGWVDFLSHLRARKRLRREEP